MVLSSAWESYNTCPPASKNVIPVSYTHLDVYKRQLEELGLLKMDFLGLRNLTVISDAEKMIRRHTPDFSIEHIPLDDKRVFHMLSLIHI